MAEQMTLDKIRDELRSFSSALAKLDGYAWATKCSSWADAIDAYLNAAKGEAVAWMVIRERDPTFPRTFTKKEKAIACADSVTLPPFAKIIDLFNYPASSDVVRDAARYRKVKQLTKEQYLTWRGMFGCSDESLDEAAIAARENKS